MYAQQVEGESWVGEKIDQGKLQKLSGKSFCPTNLVECGGSFMYNLLDEQIQQLYELMQAIQKHRTGEEAE